MKSIREQCDDIGKEFDLKPISNQSVFKPIIFFLADQVQLLKEEIESLKKGK